MKKKIITFSIYVHIFWHKPIKNSSSMQYHDCPLKIIYLMVIWNMHIIFSKTENNDVKEYIHIWWQCFSPSLYWLCQMTFSRFFSTPWYHMLSLLSEWFYSMKSKPHHINLTTSYLMSIYNHPTSYLWKVERSFLWKSWVMIQCVATQSYSRQANLR